MDQEVRRKIFLSKVGNAVLDAADAGATYQEVVDAVNRATSEARDRLVTNFSDRY